MREIPFRQGIIHAIERGTAPMSITHTRFHTTPHLHKGEHHLPHGSMIAGLLFLYTGRGGEGRGGEGGGGEGRGG